MLDLRSKRFRALSFEEMKYHKPIPPFKVVYEDTFPEFKNNLLDTLIDLNDQGVLNPGDGI